MPHRPRRRWAERGSGVTGPSGLAAASLSHARPWQGPIADDGRTKQLHGLDFSLQHSNDDCRCYHMADAYHGLMACAKTFVLSMPMLWASLLLPLLLRDAVAILPKLFPRRNPPLVLGTGHYGSTQQAARLCGLMRPACSPSTTRASCLKAPQRPAPPGGDTRGCGLGCNASAPHLPRGWEV